MIEPAPDLADGGFWYSVPPQLVADSLGPTYTSWACYPGGEEVAVVRTPRPVLGVHATPVPISAALSAAGWSEKPRGRNGG